MRVLVACEESQAVTKEFRRLGHERASSDWGADFPTVGPSTHCIRDKGSR